MQLPMFTPSSDWRPPSLSTLPSWEGASRVGIDLETCDPQLKELGPGVRRGGYIVGISFAIEDGPSAYLPIRHEGGDNLPVEGVLHYIRDQARNFTGDLCGANLGYDLDFMAEADIHWLRVRNYRDVQIAEPLIDELQNSYSLERISTHYLGVGKDEALLRNAASSYGIDPKGEMWKLPARFVGPYATVDAERPLQILRRQERIIDGQDLWEVYNLESRVLPILIKMRRRGVLIDQDKLAQVEAYCLQQEQEALLRVRNATGLRISPDDVWKAAALAPALEHIGIKVPTTPKTGKPSIKKDTLNGVEHPVAEALLRARAINKIRTTFAASIWRYMTNGRIHCTLNQLRRQKDEDGEGDSNLQGAAYGRLSSTDPNLQQQPARDPEFGPMWRSIYLPDEGRKWATLDYSQQEPRMVVHWAVKARNLIGEHAWRAAVEAAEKYRNDPTTDNHQMMADMAGIKRKAAKEIFLGLCYGMGGPKMCGKLGLDTMLAVYDRRARRSIPVDSPRGQLLRKEGAMQYEAAGPEGQALLDAFDARVPFVRKLAKAAEIIAKKRGYITTLSGRRCRFPLDEYGNYDWVHKALNRLIQGSSADQTKTAMVELDRAGYDLQLQVHDEVDYSAESREQAEAMAQIMIECTPLEVPSKVDVEIGPSWGEIA